MDKAAQYLDVIRALCGTFPFDPCVTYYVYRNRNGRFWWSTSAVEGSQPVAVITTDATGIVDARRWDG